MATDDHRNKVIDTFIMDDDTSVFSEITPKSKQSRISPAVNQNTQMDTQTDGRTHDNADDDEDNDDDIPTIAHSKTKKADFANKANRRGLFDTSDEDSVNNNNKHVKTKKIKRKHLGKNRHVRTTETKRKRLEKDNEKNKFVVENKQSRAMESSSNSNSRAMDISNKCIIPGCHFLSRMGGGLCGTHGGRKTPICSMDGCTKVARSKQLRCGEHQILNFNVDSNSNNGTDSNSKDDAKVKKQIKKDCKFHGCDKKSRGAHGFCVKHQREHNNQNPSSPLVPSVSPLAKVSKQIQDAQNKHDALERRLKGLADKLMKLKERKARLITLNSAVPTYKMGEKNTIVIPTLKEGGNDIHEAAQSFSVVPTCITGEIRTMQLNDKCNKELGNNFDDKVGILGARGVLKPNEDKLTTEDELQQTKNALDTGIQDIVSVLMLITMA
jgi:hypothetical protein